MLHRRAVCSVMLPGPAGVYHPVRTVKMGAATKKAVGTCAGASGSSSKCDVAALPSTAPTSAGCKLATRDFVLMLLVLQTTSIVLMMRYSKTRLSVDGGPPYLNTAAVLFAEILKLPLCLLMGAHSLGGARELSMLLRDEVVYNKCDTIKCAVPAVAFTLQNNLLFVALANLDAPTYQVVYQVKTVFTALFSRLILGRRLKESQWAALLMLCVGGVLVSDLRTRGSGGDGTAQSTFIGIAAVVGAALLSSSSSVYFEMMLKKQPSSAAAAKASLWLRNIQLGLFATPLAALAMLANDGERVRANGVLQGFDHIVWVIVILNGLGGLLVAATMKFADNIVKCFAAALAILSGTLLSVPIFGFELSAHFSVGVACTVCATTLYSWAPDRPSACGGGRHTAYELLPTKPLEPLVLPTTVKSCS